MNVVSASKRATRQGSVSPPPERRLRKSKSSDILHSMRRKVSLKNIRLGLGRNSSDDSEHPSLRTPNSPNPTFQLPTSSLPKRRRFPLIRPKRSAEDVPPIPPLPAESDEQSIQLDTDFDEWAMEGIVDRAALYSDGNDQSSPGTDLNSSSQSGHSNSRYGPPKLRNPFSITSVPRIRSPDPVGPTDISAIHGINEEYHVPDSWAVTPAQRDPDEESTSDNAIPTADLPRWKMRISGPDNSDYILRITANDTVASLKPQLNAKLPPEEEHETHELYLKERGGERILRPSERPANILRSCLRQAGYDESDLDGGVGRGTVGMPTVPFLFKFMYRSQFLGPADEELYFSNFVYINLAGRSLVTIPVVLHQHADTIIFMNNMFMTKVPQSIRHSATLTLLDLSSNRISSLDEAGLDELPRLATLDIQNNCLEKLPGLLPRNISFNSISALPPEIGRLTCLTKLVIVGNQISALPAEFRNLAVLRDLDCRRNQITDLALDVSHNDITELLVRRVYNAPYSNAKLSILDDDTLAQLVALRNLKLDHNSFRTLPESLGDLKQCAKRLPESFGRLQKLESLDLHSNSLTRLPVSLWNCASLSRLNVTSNLLAVWHDPPPFVPDSDDPPPVSVGKLLATSPTFVLRRPSVPSRPDIPPLAHSLEILNLAENSLTDEILHPLMILKELRVLNLSLTTSNNCLGEVFLSGNRLTTIPCEDLPRLERLSTLFLNGNHLQHLPHELGKVKSLTLLDVGNNLLKYNINNLDYDWNWNFNKNLMYLNLSGNNQLQIKSDISNHGRPSTSSALRQSLSGFSGLSQLRVLGLMDVTITSTGRNTGSDIPDESDDRRVRTSSSLVNGLSYGIADTLGKNRHPHMMDLVHEFRGIKKETVFAMFGRSHPADLTVATTSNGLAKYLKDNFIRVFISQLNSLDQHAERTSQTLFDARFLRLNQDYYDSLFGPARQDVACWGRRCVTHETRSIGNCGLYRYCWQADVRRKRGECSRDCLAWRDRVSSVRKHEPYDRAETARIRAVEGWISPPGLVSNELDISRSFGFYHLLPVVNARPNISKYELTSMDDLIIIANRGLWDYAQRTEPMAAAQKLRDLAIIIDRTLDRLKDEVAPPVGHVAIVFTDIQNSTRLWEATPSGMITALHLHNSLLRRYLRICGGYEVRTEGDSFMCSFPTVLAAVWWCLIIQVQLLKVSWLKIYLIAPTAKKFSTLTVGSYIEAYPLSAKRSYDAIRQLETFSNSRLEAPEMLSFALPAALKGRIAHNEAVVINDPPSALNLALTSPLRSLLPSDQVDITQIRELACYAMENVASVFQRKSSRSRTKSDLVSALRNLDERTLEEVWSMLYHG
ncbi:hypothetical protein B0H12DRAFT_1127492 [Mycena haematopus]|nr:hypothetical protein B0H12DRAFT_1127492 [Mycena haematopus]